MKKENFTRCRPLEPHGRFVDKIEIIKPVVYIHAYVMGSMVEHRFSPQYLHGGFADGR